MSKMASNLDRIILVTIGFVFLWFTTVTLYVFHHTSEANHIAMVNSAWSDGEGGAVTSSQGRISFIQQVFLPNKMASYDVGVGDLTHNQIHYNIPFPQSIHNEEWEVIIHPAEVMIPEKNRRADESRKEKVDHQEMKVPQFWNPSVFQPDVRTFLGDYGERLMSTEEASRIGSFARSRVQSMYGYAYEGKESDPDPEFPIEEEDSQLQETIFVAISSYRDSRCPHTVKSIFSRAKYPERIRVGIVDQLNLGNDEMDDDEREYNCAEPERRCEEDPLQVLCRYQHHIDVFEMNATLAVGPVFARHIGSRMYRGEYFTMQTDAHMEFVNDWDVSAVTQWKAAKNEMAVLTTYVSSVETHYDAKTGLSNTSNRPYMCQSEFDEDYYEENIEVMVHGQQPEAEPEEELGNDPMIQPPFFAAGFSFARGHFSVQVPYDQYLPMIFQGEEINIGLRAFSYGYDLYAPTKSFVFHYYSTDPNGKKRKVETFWEHASLYDGVESESKARLAGQIQMLVPTVNEDNSTDTRDWNRIESKKYGIGHVRPIQKFLDTFGIHLETKTVEKHLCRFVGVPMQKVFVQHLRKDGMGIDYNKIKYQFKDHKIYGKTWEHYY